MKLIIAGGRDFKDWDVFTTSIVAVIGLHGMPEEIVSGKCETGADVMGEAWANENNLPIKGFPANWKKHKKSAGPIRNQAMARYADMGIVFWDGQSAGSKNMIERLKANDKPVIVIPYTPNRS